MMDNSSVCSGLDEGVLKIWKKYTLEKEFIINRKKIFPHLHLLIFFCLLPADRAKFTLELRLGGGVVAVDAGGEKDKSKRPGLTSPDTSQLIRSIVPCPS